jgi:hypothetical protein
MVHQQQTWWSLHQERERERAMAELRRQLGASEHDEQVRRIVGAAAAEQVLGKVATAWQRGWQPGDVMHLARRRLTAAHLGLLRAAVGVQLAGYPPSTVHPHWHAQLEEFEIQLAPSPEGQWLLSGGSKDDWLQNLVVAVDVTLFLSDLPRVQHLTPLPGTVTRTAATRSGELDPKVLARVRALLAKAESTPYPAEAETFTAGAQALMARYSIDAALLAAAAEDPQGPGGVRVWIDAPYESAKAILLQAVAEANRCRVVSSKSLGFCTLVGFEPDLVAVDALFTSLLVQATHAMTLAGSRVDHLGRSRTRAFRHSFLVGFADRIGERLTEATRGEQEQAAGEAGGERLLPVLAAREAELERHVSELFPSLRRGSRISAGDGSGWASGRAAADRAALGIRGRLPA